MAILNGDFEESGDTPPVHWIDQSGNPVYSFFRLGTTFERSGIRCAELAGNSTIPPDGETGSGYQDYIVTASEQRKLTIWVRAATLGTGQVFVQDRTSFKYLQSDLSWDAARNPVVSVEFGFNAPYEKHDVIYIAENAGLRLILECPTGGVAFDDLSEGTFVGNVTVTCDPAQFAFTPAAATLRHAGKFAVEAAEYTISGAEIGAIPILIACEPAAYTISFGEGVQITTGGPTIPEERRWPKRGDTRHWRFVGLYRRHMRSHKLGGHNH